MIFHPTMLAGAYVIEPERLEDERGFFARSFCVQEFIERGLNPACVQCNISFNRWAGTVRGMHFQKEPRAEAKLVRCTSGAIYDVIVDLRPGSPTHRQSFDVELSHDNGRLLYVPEGLAHGFQTLQPASEVFYQMSAFYSAAHAGGVRWNDPAFSLNWPLPISQISPRDLAYADYAVQTQR